MFCITLGIYTNKRRFLKFSVIVNVVTKVAGLKLVGQYHSFAGDNSGDDLGSEYGFVVAKKINNYGLSLKASQYDASDKSGKADTTKVWLTATAKF